MHLLDKKKNDEVKFILNDKKYDYLIEDIEVVHLYSDYFEDLSKEF